MSKIQHGIHTEHASDTPAKRDAVSAIHSAIFQRLEKSDKDHAAAQADIIRIRNARRQ